MNLRWRPALLAALLLTACVSKPIAALRSELLAQRNHDRREQQLSQARQAARMERMEQDLREVWGSMYCKEEVRNFLRQCEINAKAGSGAESCPEKKMKDVLTFMTTQRHVVLYLKPGQALDQIPDWRKGMLRELTGQKLLITTRFLVLAHPVAEETSGKVPSERRVQQIVDLMQMDQKVPSERLLGPWLFPFRITGRELSAHLGRDDDKPKRGEPSNLELGVWVFRVDC